MPRSWRPGLRGIADRAADPASGAAGRASVVIGASLPASTAQRAALRPQRATVGRVLIVSSELLEPSVSVGKRDATGTGVGDGVAVGTGVGAGAVPYRKSHSRSVSPLSWTRFASVRPT